MKSASAAAGLLAASLALVAACDQPKPRPTSDSAPAPAPAAEAPQAPAADPAISAGLPLKPEFPGFYLDHIGAVFDPLKTPAVVSGAEPLVFDGFGFDPVAKAPAKGVDLVIDGRLHGTVYGHTRQDVADFQKVPGLTPVGFRTVLPPGALKPGPHEVIVRVVAADGSGYYQSPAIRFEVR